MPFNSPSCSLPFCLLLFSLSLLSFYGLVLWDWGLQTERVLTALSQPLPTSFNNNNNNNVGLRQGSVMYPLLFNVYMDGVVREVNVRVLGKGLEVLSANSGRFEINQLLFADDSALVAASEEKLCRLVSEFGRVCERRKL